MEFVYFWSKLHIQILFTKYSKTSSRWFDALKSFTGILFGIFLNDNFPPIWPYSSIFVKVANMEVDNVADKEVDKDKAGDVERCETEGEIWRELSEMELDDFSLSEEVWSREASQFVVDRAGEDVFWKAL